MTTRRAIRHSEIPDQNQFMFKPIQTWDKLPSNAMQTISQEPKEPFTCPPYGIEVRLTMIRFLAVTNTFSNSTANSRFCFQFFEIFG